VSATSVIPENPGTILEFRKSSSSDYLYTCMFLLVNIRNEILFVAEIKYPSSSLI